jgi:hypothetical protein
LVLSFKKELLPSRSRLMPPKIIQIPVILSALYGWLIFATSFNHPGAIGPDYNTPGTDFMVFHGGIATALKHDLRLLFDADGFTNYLNQRYHDRLTTPLAFRPWIYPPSFLLLLLPIATLPFLPALLLFQAVTAGLLACALCAGRGRWPGAGWLAALVLLSPAASVTVLWGQAAFLTCALLVAGFRLLPRHGVLAGMVLGLLSVKPQHALLVPFALVALRAWPTLLAAALTAMVLVALSAAVFGADIWRDWLAAAGHFATIDVVWDSSLHTCLMFLGASRPVIFMAELVALAGGAVLVYVVFRRERSEPVRLAVVLAAGNLAAPHTGPYDTMMLLLAGGLVLLDPRRIQPLLAWTLGLCLWMLPFIGQPLMSPPARLAPLLTLALIVWLVRQHAPGERARIMVA